MRRLSSVLVLLVLLAACGGGDDAAEPTEPPTEPTAEPTATATEEPPEPTPEPTPTEPAALAPLTGLPVDDEGVLERPVFAVKIDNHPNARPQTGLNQADVVFVELVESATRFLALYHSADPDRVGPVRSGRFVDADLVPPFEAVMAISGAAADVKGELSRAVPVLREEAQGGGWQRDSSRRAPHNLYVTPREQWASAAGERPAAEAPWTHAEELPDGGTPTTSVALRYPTAWGSAWHWDPAAGAWLRDENGAAHTDIAGERLSASTVVVAHVQRTGVTKRPFEPIGEGDAVVFRDGQRFEARWRKTGREDHFEWLLPDGSPFPLAPGRTWVELLPSGGSLEPAP